MVGEAHDLERRALRTKTLDQRKVRLDGGVEVDEHEVDIGDRISRNLDGASAGAAHRGAELTREHEVVTDQRDRAR